MQTGVSEEAMAKKKLKPKKESRKVPKEQGYEYVRAIRDAEGNLRWEYKMHGNIANRMAHDCDVSEWSDEDVVKLTCSMLDAKPEEVEVQHE